MRPVDRKGVDVFMRVCRNELLDQLARTDCLLSVGMC